MKVGGRTLVQTQKILYQSCLCSMQKVEWMYMQLYVIPGSKVLLGKIQTNFALAADSLTITTNYTGNIENYCSCYVFIIKFHFREWYDNASCQKWLRRRPLEGAFTHPSRMVYPPGDYASPAPTERPPAPAKPPREPTWEDQLPSRSPLNYEIGLIKSESQ